MISVPCLMINRAEISKRAAILAAGPPRPSLTTGLAKSARSRSKGRGDGVRGDDPPAGAGVSHPEEVIGRIEQPNGC